MRVVKKHVRLPCAYWCAICYFDLFHHYIPTLTRNEGLPVDLPTASTGKSQVQTKLVVSIDPQGSIALNRQPVKEIDLVVKIQAFIDRDGQTLVIINADAHVEHGRVVAVMDRVRQIPGVKLAIATQRK